MTLVRSLLLIIVAFSTAAAKPQAEWLAVAEKRMVTEVLPDGLLGVYHLLVV